MRWPKIEFSTQVWEDFDFLRSQMARFLGYVTFVGIASVAIGYFLDPRATWIGHMINITLSAIPLLSYKQWRRKQAEKAIKTEERAESGE